MKRVEWGGEKKGREKKSKKKIKSEKKRTTKRRIKTRKMSILLLLPQSVVLRIEARFQFGVQSYYRKYVSHRHGIVSDSRYHLRAGCRKK